jgi:hypothetical protein
MIFRQSGLRGPLAVMPIGRRSLTSVELMLQA